MRGDRDRLLDMVEMCDLLTEHIDDVNRLDSDPVLQAAAQRWIEILGEAASKLSDDITGSRPEVPWRNIVGTRIILAHAYFNIEPTIIRSVIEHEIPALRTTLVELVRSLESTEEE